MIVCLCTAADDTAVREAIDGGAGTVDEVAQSACRAGSGCGGCREFIQEMIEAKAETGPALPPILEPLPQTS